MTVSKINAIHLRKTKVVRKCISECFEQKYIDYKQNINTLLPWLRLVKTAFGHQKFNWGKMILKEYNSVYVYFSGILIIAFFQDTKHFTFCVRVYFCHNHVPGYQIYKHQKRTKLKTNVSKVQEGYP